MNLLSKGKTPEHESLRINKSELRRSIAPFVGFDQHQLRSDLQSTDVVVSGNFTDPDVLLDNALKCIAEDPRKFYALLGVLGDNYQDVCHDVLRKMRTTFVAKLEECFTLQQEDCDCNVFISYDKSSASDSAKTLHQELSVAGLQPWSDSRSIVRDDDKDLTDEVFSTLTACHAIVPIVTNEYAKSITCLREFCFAISKGKLYVSLMIHIDKLDDITAGKWLKANSKETYEWFYREKLIKRLKSKIMKVHQRDQELMSAAKQRQNPQPENVIRNPRIPATQLSEETREDLYQQVMADMRKIRRNFSSLQEQIWKSIDDIQGLVRLVLGMSILSEDDEKQIRQTPSNVSIILTKYWSFLDFENLEHIVEEKCSCAEKRMMKEYKEEVQQLCKRRVSEFPRDSLGNGGNDPGMKEMYVTLNLDDPALKRIQHLKIVIANILGCRASELVLQNIEYGSVLVTFLLTAAVGAKLFLEKRALTAKQKAALKDQHVTSLKYEMTLLFAVHTEKEGEPAGVPKSFSDADCPDCIEKIDEIDRAVCPDHDEKISIEDEIDDDAYKVFHCPCGQCSLESYLEEGCPKSNSDSFPFLDISKLDEDDKEDLTQQLSQEHAHMTKRFANLMDETRMSLVARGVPVQKLVFRALSLVAYESENIPKPLLSEDEKELKCSETIDKAFTVLIPYMSFFNFELLKHITDSEELCSDSDRTRMGEYISKFGMFCKRKVFEVSPGTFGQPTSKLKKRKRKAFAVLMTKHEAEPNLVSVNAAKQRIANVLKLKPSTLHLHRIDEGSILLVFSVPNFVARKLFPLQSSTVAQLKDEGFLVLAPPATEESCKNKSMKRKRMSWPLKNKEKEVKVTKSFSLDSLYVKDDSRRAFLLLFSALNGKTEIVQALVGAETNDILYSQWNGKSALMLAAQSGHTKTVRALLNAGAEVPVILDLKWKGNTALMLAAKGGNAMTVKVLIEAGADMTKRDIYENTAVMLAAQGGHTETVKALIEAGADVNISNKSKETALMLAAERGYTEAVKALIEAGADINLQNKYDQTALMLAAQGGYTEAVKALIEAGADINLQNKASSRSLHIIYQ